MLALIRRTFGQLDDPAIRSIMWFGIGVAAIVFALTWFGLAYLLQGQIATGYAWLDGPANWLIQLLGAAAVLIMVWLLYPALVSAIIGVFLERIAEAVERRHYGDLPPARDSSIAENVVIGLRFALVTIGLNLLFLPLYLALPALNLVLYLALNGWLIARNFYEVVALRRLTPAEAVTVRRAERMRLMSAGVVIALGMMVPIVNLLTPILATILMVHVFHSLRSVQEISQARHKTLVFPNKIG
jgi:CysZ protein